VHLGGILEAGEEPSAQLINAYPELNEDAGRYPFGDIQQAKKQTVGPARVNLSEADFFGNHCVVVCPPSAR
jgi:hypothetical protein